MPAGAAGYDVVIIQRLGWRRAVKRSPARGGLFLSRFDCRVVATNHGALKGGWRWKWRIDRFINSKATNDDTYHANVAIARHITTQEVPAYSAA